MFVLLLLQAARALAVPAQIAISRIDGRITVDGVVTEAAWQNARRIDTFVEYFRGDNAEPPARTTGFIGYDHDAVYVAFIAEDPRPAEIRAPLVDRDKVLADQDYVAILLDTLNDRRSGVAFRVNARGVLTDSVVNDSTGEEDFSPDFFYDAVAVRTPAGWSAELRIPLSSLRYPSVDPQTWGVILMRNYPRDFRYIMANTPIPRNSNCFLCHAATLAGLEGLPTGSHFTLTPYTTASVNDRMAAGPGEGGRQLPPARRSFENDQGLDFKWNPSTRLTIDATLNPDFSQIESDVPQLAVNSRFALSYPEKRTFFLEGVELLSTPMQAVYTRAITAPAWGLRATGQSGASAYTLFVAEDRGGGVTIIPGPYGSTTIPQERARVAIGRVRRTFGDSFVGLLATAREVDGGGHNRVFGPDYQWNLTKKDRFFGQALLSDTDGDRGHATRVVYTHTSDRWDAYSGVRVVSPEFRADNGFMPQAGLEQTYQEIAARFRPKSGMFTYIRAFAGLAYAREYDGHEMLWRQVHPGFFFQGKWGSEGWMTYRFNDRERVNGKVLDLSFVEFSVRAAPHRWVPAIKIEGALGEKIDYAGGRLGSGGNVSLSGSIRPTDQLELQATLSRDWLNLDSGRLFTARVDWVKATYTFSARSLVRLVGQQSDIEREGAPRDRSLSLSGLYGYRLNFQTVFFVGYGDSSITDGAGRLFRDRRSLFMKVAYAFQR